MNVRDVHTHNIKAGSDAIINIEPGQSLPPEGIYSTGVHPWRSSEAEILWPYVEKMAVEPRIVAIGECGLDRLRGADMNIQTELLQLHALLAENTGKPLIIHCVRAWAELIALRRNLKPAQPWIVHGFRGNPQLAMQLLDAGMHISLGEHFRPETAAIIPRGRLHVETDCSPLSIDEIAQSVAAARKSTDYNQFISSTIFT